MSLPLVNPEQASAAGAPISAGGRLGPTAPAVLVHRGPAMRVSLAASAGLAAVVSVMLLASGCTTAATLQSAQAAPMSPAHAANLKRIPEGRMGRAVDPAEE